MTVTVIVPTYNEEDVIESLIRELKEQPREIVEIIVADGGSTDGTLEILGDLNVTVINGPKSRGAQMDLAARWATTDVLLFLHADVKLPVGWLNKVFEVLTDSDIMVGAFSIEIDEKGRKYRVLEKLANLRASLLKIVYGDEAIFVRAADFKKVGGFKGMALMEDLSLVRRLRELGKAVVLKDKVLVSPRRWQKNGVVKNTIKNFFIVTLYYFGVSEDKLYKIYYK